MITSAGAVLAGTFAVLGALPVTFLAGIGIAVAFGILLDTIVVRSVLVTALAGNDLAVFAVEAVFGPVVPSHHVAPRAADPQVYLNAGHLSAVAAPPAPDQVRRRPRPAQQLPGRVKRRVITISVSAGSVTVAVPLFAFVTSVLALPAAGELHAAEPGRRLVRCPVPRLGARAVGIALLHLVSTRRT